jgi:hypothetical protein
MSDVFLSYATEDRGRLGPIVAALESRGWTVWWDRTIAPGLSFDREIERALNAAKCVVVLWSASSVESDWVKIEAAEAAGRRVLVPAMIDEVVIPLEFRRIQAARLVGWSGEEGNQELERLLDAVGRILGHGSPARPSPVVDPPPHSPLPPA